MTSRARWSVLTVLLLALAIAKGAASQEEPPERKPEEDIKGTAVTPSYPRILVLDGERVLTAPFHWSARQWLLVTGYTAVVVGLSFADERLSADAREGGTNLRFVGDTLEGLGDGRSLAYLGAFYVVGLIAKDEKARNVFFDGLSASLYSAGMITPVLATVIGRSRPTTEDGAYTFRPFGGRSFPSGHTTQMFAVASVIATSYDQTWVSAVAYAGATVGAWIRLERGKHFPSDILAGAIIGTAVGRTVVHYNRELRTKGEEAARPAARVSLLPLVSFSERSYGIAGRITF